MEISFLGEKGEFTIPPNTKQIVEMPLGIHQPLGIASDETGYRVAIADYFMPAIGLVEVAPAGGGLFLKFTWVGGVEHEGRFIRLFPDVSQWGGVNRAQTVNFGLDGSLLVSRNGGREFFSLLPKGEQWVLGEKISLPEIKTLPHQPRDDKMVHSALLNGTLLTTIESSRDLAQWSLNEYGLRAGRPEFIESDASLPWMYGMDQREEQTGIYFVTDLRYTGGKPGIYRRIGQSHDLVVPGVYGNGICFLADGSALVTRYASFIGQFSALIFIPAYFFE